MRALYNLRGSIDLLRLPKYMCKLSGQPEKAEYEVLDIGTDRKIASKEKISSADYSVLIVRS